MALGLICGPDTRIEDNSLAEYQCSYSMMVHQHFIRCLCKYCSSLEASDKRETLGDMCQALANCFNLSSSRSPLRCFVDKARFIGVSFRRTSLFICHVEL